jgi:tripartite-type tricarboxylate transporter receptor subunit TctC
VGLTGNGAYVLVIHPGMPAKTVSEFIAVAKAKPGHLNYASTGHGKATHLAGELFKVLTGVDMVNIYYKGGGPALVAVIGGQVSVFFAGVVSSAGHIKSGKVRALGVSTASRSAALPDVPTIAEAGVPGYEVNGWYGLLAPARTPQAIVERVNQELKAVLATADAKERLLAIGIQARAASAEEFRRMIANDMQRRAGVVKKARIEPQ